MGYSYWNKSENTLFNRWEYLNEESPYYITNFRKGEVIILDELIADSIVELNRKGYETEYSCSGHMGEEIFYPYIIFTKTPNTEKILDAQFKYWKIEELDLDDPKYSLFNDADIEKFNNRITIVFDTDTYGMSAPYTQDRLNQIYDAVTDLRKIVMYLPDLSNN